MTPIPTNGLNARTRPTTPRDERDRRDEDGDGRANAAEPPRYKRLLADSANANAATITSSATTPAPSSIRRRAVDLVMEPEMSTRKIASRTPIKIVWAWVSVP